ncbi:MAG TPA: hypothetical protein VK550_22005 [Polyangiaceae bacterium]|nr:hypothetical protein [Polyangiaceae bacterium]
MLGSWQHFLVVGIALVFAAFLLWKYRPSPGLGEPLARSYGWRRRHSAPVETKIREALGRARQATTPRERAEALVTAAEAAALAPDGITSAMGFYLRAMRADVTFSLPVEGIAALLAAERPELLEHVLWRRLAHLDWSRQTSAAKTTLEALIGLYQGERGQKDRARALQKIAARL